ncbi:hypothetical protein Thiosp_04724 [Thiorhodovibrio litoralis]|nr:hypothetical protein Thiosp_04724 [Thiorhodovibrio litoralis]
MRAFTLVFSLITLTFLVMIPLLWFLKAGKPRA